MQRFLKEQPEILANFKPEFALMTACICGDNTRTNKLIYSSDQVDWAHFLYLCKRHRVETFVSRYTNGATDIFPSSVINILREREIIFLKRNLLLFSELQRILNQFTSAGIRALNLKGIALSIQLYQDKDLRQGRDIDMLVGIDEVSVAADILEGLGFICRDSEAINNFMNHAKYRSLYHHISFIKPENKVCVELHWRMIAFKDIEFMSFDDLWNSKSTVESGKLKLYVPGIAPHLLFACIHGAHHYWSQFLWITDLLNGLTNKENRISLLELAIKYQMVNLIEHSFEITDQLFGTEFLDDMKTRGSDKALLHRMQIRSVIGLKVDSQKEMTRFCYRIQRATAIYRLTKKPFWKYMRYLLCKAVFIFQIRISKLLLMKQRC